MYTAKQESCTNKWPNTCWETYYDNRLIKCKIHANKQIYTADNYDHQYSDAYSLNNSYMLSMHRLV